METVTVLCGCTYVSKYYLDELGCTGFLSVQKLITVLLVFLLNIAVEQFTIAICNLELPVSHQARDISSSWFSSDPPENVLILLSTSS
jgi:hypothetical protein